MRHLRFLFNLRFNFPKLEKQARRAYRRIFGNVYSSQRLGWLIGSAFLTWVLVWIVSGSRVAAQTVLIEEGFRGNATFGWNTGAGLGTAFQPCLTAGVTPVNGSIPPCQPGPGIPDPVGNGVLRLTTDETGQSTFAFYNLPFPSGVGLSITFDYFSYGGQAAAGSQADGISFFLFDGNTLNPQPGAFGASLGYAQRTGVPGLTDGYVSVGLDEFGNFANDDEGRGAGCIYVPPITPALGATRILDSVTVRGSNIGNSRTEGYCFLGNSGTLAQGIDVPNAFPTTRDLARRSVRIVITRDFQLSVFIDFTGTRTFSGPPVVGPIDLRNTTLFPNQRTNPPSFKLGFASSTGDATNFHEIQNLRVTTLSNPVTPPRCYVGLERCQP